MNRKCNRKQIDGTVCDGEMICYLYTRPPNENMYACNKCGRRASGSALILEDMRSERESGKYDEVLDMLNFVFMIGLHSKEGKSQ